MTPRHSPELPQDRERIFNVSPVVVWLMVIITMVHGFLSVLPVEYRDEALWQLALIPAREMAFWGHGAFHGSGIYQLMFSWTPVTSIFLHGNWTHLVVNLVWLLAFGSPMVRVLGPWWFILFYLLCGLAGSMIYMALNIDSTALVIGASGAVSGLMGGVIGMMFWPRLLLGSDIIGGENGWASSPKPSSIVMFVGVWLVINFLFGWAGIGPAGEPAAIAWEAHMGGFLAGFLLIRPFLRRLFLR
ncbi:MAG: rhomboid family intramembrane serine protease [Parvularculales bacterium]